MKIWISKYALTAGITEHECVLNGDRIYPGKPFGEFTGFAIGIDAHKSYEEAAKVAETARVKRIQSLEMQIRKLKQLSFLTIAC